MPPDIGSARLEIDEVIARGETEQGALPATGTRQKLPWAVAGALALVLVIALWAPWGIS